MEFRILGPVEVRVDGQPAEIGHAKQRCVLAVLLLELGRMVPIDLLIDRVWGEHPPASVRSNVYAYMTRLKVVIAAASAEKVSLVRRPGGYLLEADPELLDLHRFRRLVACAGVADDVDAATLLRDALGLWHGQALAGMSSPWLSGMRDALDQQRIVALLHLTDVALRQGQHNSVVSALATEAITYPTNERLIGQLMLTLYLSGRQAEALQCFEQTRQRLAADLGADPGRELSDLHRRMLRSDPSLEVRGPAQITRPAVTQVAAGPVPRELPGDIPAFTGRASELDELDRLLGIAAAGTAGGTTAAVISAVSGTAGVGKTALAVHWAHRSVWLYPDGQLYVNLRGYDLAQPMTAAEALAGFLRALGVSGQNIPQEVGERAARYRSLLTGKRMLVVLDNARDAEQVRPLLPGSPTCPAVVTSRDSLAGLVARDGAGRLDLGLLPAADAVGLLRALIGARVDADPESARLLAIRCGRLPLALRVAAELAVARPARSLAELAGELAGGQRLDLLDADGDQRTAVRTVFSWSYRHLDADVACAFRYISLHPGPDLDAYAAAALSATTAKRAAKLLEQLERAHLIQPAGPSRYGMHDLLRDYAHQLAASEDGGGGVRSALTRLFDYYLHAAACAMNTLFPNEADRLPSVPPSAAPIRPLADRAQAREWLDAQRPALVAAVWHCADCGWPEYATRLAAILFRYLDSGGHYEDARVVYGHALRAARDRGDRAAQAEALTNLGATDQREGLRQQAIERLEAAAAIAAQAGSLTIEARATSTLGNIDIRQGRYDQANLRHERALALHRAGGDRTGETRALINLGIVSMLQGRYRQATECYGQALSFAIEAGNKDSQAYSHGNLGHASLLDERLDEAAYHFEQAISVFQEIGNRIGEAHAMTSLGEADRRLGHHRRAIAHHETALTTFRAIHDVSGEVVALNGLGEVLLATGQPRQARDRHTTALGLAEQSGELDQQARAHTGLANASQVMNDLSQAREHLVQALYLYTRLGAPEAEIIRARLAETREE